MPRQMCRTDRSTAAVRFLPDGPVDSGLGAHRKADGEHGPPVLEARTGGHGTGVSSDDGGDDGQSEAGAAMLAGPGRLDPIEALEHPTGLIATEAGAVVGHLDDGVASIRE